MAYRKSTEMRKKYGDDVILTMAKDTESKLIKAIDAFDGVLQNCAEYYNAHHIMSSATSVHNHMTKLKAQIYSYNLNEYDIDKSELRALNAVDSDKINNAIDAAYTIIVNKIFDIIYNNRKLITNVSTIFVMKSDSVGYKIKVAESSYMAKLSIKILDIIDGTLSAKGFLDLVKRTANCDDTAAYGILTDIFNELEKYVRIESTGAI